MPGCFMGVLASVYSQCACHAGLALMQAEVVASFDLMYTLRINGLQEIPTGTVVSLR